MKSILLKVVFPAILVASVATPLAQAQLGSTVPNWRAPASPFASSARGGGIRALGDVTGALPFVGVAPCRIVDTRGPAGPYGGPSLAAASPRDFALPGGPCPGIPADVSAYSLNVTVTNTQGPGFIQIYPREGSVPAVSTLNYVAGQTLANAAIVPAGPDGGITVVAGVSGTDLIIDINGYFPITLNQNNTLELTGNRKAGSIITGVNLATPENSIGVYGVAVSGNGVLGTTNGSTEFDTGVCGRAGNTGTPVGLSSGVFGTSTRGYGVWGVSTVSGVKGTFVDNTGPRTVGYLGHDATNGVFATGNIAATGVKTFVDPHPLRAGKAIVYVALEGPEAGTYFRGRGTLHNGTGVISVPESFRLVSDEEGLTVQVTPIGQAANVAVVSADLNSVVVRSTVRELDFYYIVNGVRKAFKDWDPMAQPDYFVPETPDARMPPVLAPEQQRRLIANGTHDADGSVNMATAERMGWTRIWADRARQAQAAAAKAASE